LEVPCPSAGASLDALALEAEPGAQLSLETLSQLFYDSLALSAWKRASNSAWSLRVNPSSGNLHPTEAYAVVPPVPRVSERASVLHYTPFEHGLEVRRSLDDNGLRRLLTRLAPGGLLVALTSIPWREAWKYGERAFRYCQLDVGHAIASVAYAASVLGWRAREVFVADPLLSSLLAIDDERGPEQEHGEILLALSPRPGAAVSLQLSTQDVAELEPSAPLGRPGPLSAEHHSWPIIEEVFSASRRLNAGAPPASPATERALTVEHPLRSQLSARQLFRTRRSAVAMRPHASSMGVEQFVSMMGRCLCGQLPLNALQSPSAVHLFVFVHRVVGLESGLYVLVRDEPEQARLRAACDPRFAWRRAFGDSSDLPLFELALGDVRDAAQRLSCGQAIAADGCFAIAMVSDYERALQERGPNAYRTLHWEAGALGQVLYLQAEAVGLRATGIGCFFDDDLHAVLGLDPAPRTWQVLYHFTVGAPEEDSRIQTLAAYHHRNAPTP
jgi:SagB-type dehydrogenase family enzyme